jgi:hypothetical protein
MESNQITVAEEHMGTAITQFVMSSLYEHLGAPMCAGAGSCRQEFSALMNAIPTDEGGTGASGEGCPLAL